MTTYAPIVLLAAAIGLALACVAGRPSTVRAIWPAAACLAGMLLGLPAVSVVAVTVLAGVLTWPVRRAWT